MHWIAWGGSGLVRRRLRTRAHRHGRGPTLDSPGRTSGGHHRAHDRSPRLLDLPGRLHRAGRRPARGGSSRGSSTRAPRRASSSPGGRSRSPCSSTPTSQGPSVREPTDAPWARPAATPASCPRASSRASLSPASTASSGPTRTTASRPRCCAGAPARSCSGSSVTARPIRSSTRRPRPRRRRTVRLPGRDLLLRRQQHGGILAEECTFANLAGTRRGRGGRRDVGPGEREGQAARLHHGRQRRVPRLDQRPGAGARRWHRDQACPVVASPERPAAADGLHLGGRPARWAQPEAWTLPSACRCRPPGRPVAITVSGLRRQPDGGRVTTVSPHGVSVATRAPSPCQPHLLDEHDLDGHVDNLRRLEFS